MFPKYTENPPDLMMTKQDYLRKSSKNPPWKSFFFLEIF